MRAKQSVEHAMNMVLSSRPNGGSSPRNFDARILSSDNWVADNSVFRESVTAIFDK